MTVSSTLIGSIEDYFPYPENPSTSNYGLTGIYHIPNARFMKEGSMRFNFSSTISHSSSTSISSFCCNFSYSFLQDLSPELVI